MNITKIKHLLYNGEIAAVQVNQIIDLLEIKDLDKLSENEKVEFRDVINNMLLLAQDSNTGAYIVNPEKAERLLLALG